MNAFQTLELNDGTLLITSSRTMCDVSEDISNSYNRTYYVCLCDTVGEKDRPFTIQRLHKEMSKKGVKTCFLPAASATADPTMAPLALLARAEAIC